jgi:hypothetical protein
MGDAQQPPRRPRDYGEPGFGELSRVAANRRKYESGLRAEKLSQNPPALGPGVASIQIW